MSAESLTPGLMLIHGNRAEQLRDILVSWLRHHPLAPLETECILVQSNGIAQWLRLALARQDTGCGIAAALAFVLPSRFMWQAYRALLGEARVPLASPLDKETLIWRIMRLLPEVARRDGFEVLARFLASGDAVRKRHQLAHRLADLFDQYQVYRADWLTDWRAGRDVLATPTGATIEVPPAQAWQAALWRIILQDVAPDAAPVGRAAIHSAALAAAAALEDDPAARGLPRRVVVFGVSSLPRQTLEMLAALGRRLQVLVFVHNPCEHYWADIVGEREALRTRFRRQQRRHAATRVPEAAGLHVQAHPLLASWGRQGRDFIAMLDDFDDPGLRARSHQALAALHERVDVFEPLPGDTLLQQLQDDIRDLRPLAETQARWPAVDVSRDTSMRFCVAHSAQREVEILHDQLLAAFEADASLAPRDVIVMVPDITLYAPHVRAVFGLPDPQDARHIPYMLADRAQRHSDPLVIVFEQLLALERLRLDSQEVLAWLDVPAVRTRFGIHEEELPLLQRWVQEANVRWGLNADQRAGFGLDQSAEAAHAHTWAFGLQRLLLGYATGPGAPAWQGIEPCGEPGGLGASAVGGLARLLQTLDHYWHLLRQPAAPAVWVSRLAGLLDDCFEPASDADEYTLARVRQVLQDWLEHCERADFTEPVPVSVVAEHCLAALDEAGLSQRFFAGAVTFATLMPMRAIPFRRVCLLGMQDGAFPRQRVPADFDLMARFPRAGDRSPREDDRYLFLEALLSARDQFTLSWIGQSVHDNSVQPPSVLVAQLFEHLDRGWQCADGRRLSQALTCHHPLQPFSTRYFPSEAMRRSPAQWADDAAEGSWFTFAAEWRAQLTASPESKPPARSTSDGRGLPAPQPGEEPRALEALRRFLRDPVRAFFEWRLRTRYPSFDAAADNVEPYALDGLARWQLREALLHTVTAADARASADVDALRQRVEEALYRARRQGALPVGEPGRQLARSLAEAVQPALEGYVQVCAQWPHAEPEALPIMLAAQATPLGACPGFSGEVRGWRRNAAGEWCCVRVLPSHLVDPRGHYRLEVMTEAWVDHVVAHLCGRSGTTVLLSPKGQVSFAPLGEAADRCWQALHQGWQTGLCWPLPVDVHTAAAWVREGADESPGSPALEAARIVYETQLERSLYLRRSYPDFAALNRAGGFVHWARTLYLPLREAIASWPGAGGDS